MDFNSMQWFEPNVLIFMGMSLFLNTLIAYLWHKKYYQKIHVLKSFLLGLKERNKKQEEHLMKNMKANHKRNKNNENLKQENTFQICILNK